MQDFEKLGTFYLGRGVNEPGQSSSDGELLLYDAKDLTTHALCVGMTGSGKTGLCVGMLEEAAIDGIPAIVIDPKGDIGNLMLAFPGLSGYDFRPWIDESEAARKGLSPDDFAAKTAATWKNGLASWGQDASRIEKMKAAAEVSIYTPGSSAGLPLTVLKSFNSPGPEIRADHDALRDRVMAAVSGLLALLGIEADPVQSREHILLSNIVQQAWVQGQNLELADLIRAIMTPPFDQLGVFDVETFYPSSDRNALAMQLNNVLASPSFSAWREGDPIDIARLLHTPSGKPRISILSIAHLNDAERMFFVTMVLNELTSWMRQQAGTSSLRAIFYMDEIFGYFPPSANPPSKGPMLTLLKQARAFGLGCVLATQNPVDLDYKGLGNTGTWFIGRLQTERDKLRVLDGLEGASAAAGQKFSRADIDRALSGLGNRVFLMNNVHDDVPVLFETRWVMSYLRGPLTRFHIEKLMAGQKGVGLAGAGTAPGALSAPTFGSGASAAPMAARSAQVDTVLPGSIKQLFLLPTRANGQSSRIVFQPMLAASAQLHFVSAKGKMDDWRTAFYVTPFPEGHFGSIWDDCLSMTEDWEHLDTSSPSGAELAPLPAAAASESKYKTWKSMLESHVYQNAAVTLWFDPKTKLMSDAGESEGSFRVRVQQANREARDLALEKLRQSYAPKLAAVEERIRKAEMKVDREESQYERSKINTAVSMGSTLLGALLGRKAVSVGSLSRAASTMNRAGSTMREKGDIARAQEDVAAAQQKLRHLEAVFQEDTDKLASQYEEVGTLDEILVRPRKSDISVSDLRVIWTPWAVDSSGIATPLY